MRPARRVVPQRCCAFVSFYQRDRGAFFVPLQGTGAFCAVTRGGAHPAGGGRGFMLHTRRSIAVLPPPLGEVPRVRGAERVFRCTEPGFLCGIAPASAFSPCRGWAGFPGNIPFPGVVFSVLLSLRFCVFYDTLGNDLIPRGCAPQTRAPFLSDQKRGKRIA